MTPQKYSSTLTKDIPKAQKQESTAFFFKIITQIFCQRIYGDCQKDSASLKHSYKRSPPKADRIKIYMNS